MPPVMRPDVADASSFVKPHVDLRLKPGWSFREARDEFVSEGGEAVSIRGSLRAAARSSRRSPRWRPRPRRRSPSPSGNSPARCRWSSPGERPRDHPGRGQRVALRRCRLPARTSRCRASESAPPRGRSSSWRRVLDPLRVEPGPGDLPAPAPRPSEDGSTHANDGTTARQDRPGPAPRPGEPGRGRAGKGPGADGARTGPRPSTGSRPTRSRGTSRSWPPTSSKAATPPRAGWTSPPSTSPPSSAGPGSSRSATTAISRPPTGSVGAGPGELPLRDRRRRQGRSRSTPDRVGVAEARALDIPALGAVQGRLRGLGRGLKPEDVAGKVVLVELPDLRQGRAGRAGRAVRGDPRFQSRMAAAKPALLDQRRPRPRRGHRPRPRTARRPPAPGLRPARRRRPAVPTITVHDPRDRRLFDAMPRRPGRGDRLDPPRRAGPPAGQAPQRRRPAPGLRPGAEGHVCDGHRPLRPPRASGGRPGPTGSTTGPTTTAAGTVSVIELASALSTLKERPRRSLVFVTFFGEEQGLLGSRYYGRHPVVPVEQDRRRRQPRAGRPDRQQRGAAGRPRPA